MKLSAEGLRALQGYEGLRLAAYRDAGGVWTIGYGHTGPEVVEGLTWTREEAEAALARDTEWAQAAVRNDVTVPLTQPQFDALVSLVYNIGAGAFARSTLLRLLNAGDYRGAAEQFLVWNTVQGQMVTGLAVRRAKERAMFLEAAPIVESKPVLEKPTMADTLQTVATVAGVATGNLWLGPAMAFLRDIWPELKPLVPTGSEVAQRNLKAAEAVMGAVMAATGTDNPPDAVKAVQNDPVMAQQARSAAIDVLDHFGLVEIAGGVAAARTWSASPSTPEFWKTGAFWLSAVLLAMIACGFYVVLRDGSPFGGDTRATVVGALIGCLNIVCTFWLGLSFSRSTTKPPGQ